MHYIFVIHGRADYKDRIQKELESQLSELSLTDYRFYFTNGPGDATRFVRIHNDLHPKEEECFVACGGSGIVNEVVSGIIGFPNKKMAIMAFGSTNDFTKLFPERNFMSIKAILNGEDFKSDIIKVNDYYSLNVINSGFDAHVAWVGNNYIAQGMEGAKAYRKAIFKCLLSSRFNKAVIEVDGKRISGRRFLLCDIGNGRYCGGQFLCCPKAEVDDGMMDFCYFRAMSLLSFLICMKYYAVGEQFTNKFCRKRATWYRANNARIRTKNKLIHLCLDGEIVASRDFHLEVLPKAVNLILPL